MKKKFLTICILTVALIGVAAVFTGCSTMKPASYDYLVTFDYNTDALGLSASQAPVKQYLGVMDGMRIMQPVKAGTAQYAQTSFKEQQVPRYAVESWHLPVLDADGKVQKNEDGSVQLGKQWNFRMDTVTENITLYAKLQLKPSITLYSGVAERDEYGNEKKDEEGNIVGLTMEHVNRFLPGTNVTQIQFKALAPSKENYTFAGYYADEALTTPFAFPFTMGDQDMRIYARFIEGANWSIVTTAEEFNKAFTTSGRIYLENDIDFDGVSWKGRMEFGGEIAGNGHTVTNIYSDITGDINNNSNLGLFGKLRKSANIHDITLSNVTVRVSTRSKVPASAGMLAGEIEDGATLKNVKMSGNILRGSVAEGGEITLLQVAPNFNSKLAEKEITVVNCDFSGITGYDAIA